MSLENLILRRHKPLLLLETRGGGVAYQSHNGHALSEDTAAHHLLRSYRLAVDEGLEARREEAQGDKGAQGNERLLSSLCFVGGGVGGVTGLWSRWIR